MNDSTKDLETQAEMLKEIFDDGHYRSILGMIAENSVLLRHFRSSLSPELHELWERAAQNKGLLKSFQSQFE